MQADNSHIFKALQSECPAATEFRHTAAVPNCEYAREAKADQRAVLQSLTVQFPIVSGLDPQLCSGTWRGEREKKTAYSGAESEVGGLALEYPVAG
jgi:hypothetical protein